MVQNYEKAMEKFGDWLYIIFIGIAIVSSLISSLNKVKKQRETPPSVPQKSQPAEQSTVFPTSARPTPARPAPAPAVQPAPKPVKQSKLKSGTPPPSGKKNVPEERFQSRISRMIERQNLPETEAEHASVEINPNDISEIKKGIIYSEIISRKY